MNHIRLSYRVLVLKGFVGMARSDGIAASYLLIRAMLNHGLKWNLFTFCVVNSSLKSIAAVATRGLATAKLAFMLLFASSIAVSGRIEEAARGTFFWTCR